MPSKYSKEYMEATREVPVVFIILFVVVFVSFMVGMSYYKGVQDERIAKMSTISKNYDECWIKAEEQGLITQENYFMGVFNCASIALDACAVNGCREESEDALANKMMEKQDQYQEKYHGTQKAL